jgi:hypothetical protein
MKRAALGIRMHSGWGVLVVVAGDANSVEIIDRKRIDITDLSLAGSTQPYHYAANLGLSESESYLAKCAAGCERLAIAALKDIVDDLSARQVRIVGAAVLLAAGRPLPSLSNILASHALIHTAEGEFFRSAASKACERLKIPVTAIRERDLEERAGRAFGDEASQLQRLISTSGKTIGPPWTKDHKAAALAASITLASGDKVASC